MSSAENLKSTRPKYYDNHPIDLAAAHRDLHNEVYVRLLAFVFYGPLLLYTPSSRNADGNGFTAVMKVGRVAIITRGRYAGKKVRLPFFSWIFWA